MKPARRLAFAAVLLLAAACGKDDGASAPARDGAALETLEFRHPGSPGWVTLEELAEDLGYLAPVKLKNIGISTGGPQGIQMVLSGDSDISSQSFTGAIVKVVASGAPVTAVIAAYGTGRNDLGGYYVLEDSPIHGPRDLIGKKIAVNTHGAQMEFMLREYLARGGLSGEEIDSVELIVVPPGSTEQVLRQRQVDVAPFYFGIGAERGGVRRLFRDYELFGPITVGAYVMSNRFLAEKPNTARHVIGGLARAIEWTKQTPLEEAHARLRGIIEKRRRNENPAMVEFWTGLGLENSPHGLLDDKDFQIWVDWLVKDGQLQPGQVDLRKVYTNAFNPYAQSAPQ
ncbi:MAG: ABC transporter substrate-binding protein [Azoarcus sp.]|jgi:ABC-type nitrate/sulfonate/bicarbonate transport system substrate-binding protein|nr:ABC transporter substrate-binding protein [Azoarcus sp.]